MDQAMTPLITEWESFLETVEVSGPIPMLFKVDQDERGVAYLTAYARIQDRLTSMQTNLIQSQRVHHGDKSRQVRDLMLQVYRHEALEWLRIGGELAFDPHRHEKQG